MVYCLPIENGSIVIAVNTLCLVKFYIQWCWALQWNRWRSYLKQLICSCLASQFSGKSTKVGSPPNFPKLISQLWGIPQPQYFITLLLDAHWTYFWKHYMYYKKDTKIGSHNFGYQIWFCTRLLIHACNIGPVMKKVSPCDEAVTKIWKGSKQIGHIAQWPLLGLLSWYPLILVKSPQIICTLHMLIFGLIITPS